MTPHADPAKRIPKSLNTDPHLFGSYSLADVAVALFPGVVVVLCTQLLFPTATVAGYSIQTLTLPIAGVAIVVGAVFVTLTPSYTSSLDWLQTVVGFYSSDRELEHDEAKAYTQLERVHDDRDAIERTDGTLVGFVQVDPPNMALATDEQWSRKADAFEDFLNTVVEFPIQIYSTTRAFPVADYLSHFESRLGDPDVKANPRLATLIEHYIEWYEADLERRQMTIRDHYVVVEVSPADVQFERESLIWTLAGVPVLGPFIRAMKAPPRDEQRAAMFTALDQRTDRVTRGLREIEGCRAHRIAGEEATALVGSFWAGEDVSKSTTARSLRTRPLVGGP